MRLRPAKDLQRRQWQWQLLLPLHHHCRALIRSPRPQQLQAVACLCACSAPMMRTRVDQALVLVQRRTIVPRVPLVRLRLPVPLC